MSGLNKNIVLWVIIGLFLFGLFNVFQTGRDQTGVTEVAYSSFKQSLEQGQIQEVQIKGKMLTGRFVSGEHFLTYAPPQDPLLIAQLDGKNVTYSVQPPDEGGGLFQHLLTWLFPMLILVGVWIFLLRQMQAGNNKALGFGKSRAKVLNENQVKVTFDDVAGVEEAKQEVEEIVEFLRDPKKFQKLGGKIPKGVLMLGQPGTGKTLLARAIAGEADVPFFSISGSDFVEMFVGVGASRVRDLFEQGKKNAPCIIFIDEIDAVGRHRGAGLGGGNDEREQTLNQLLVEMDGFESNQGVILIAATNRPDVLDPALLRPGRFDRQVVVPLPDVKGRTQILVVHMRNVPLGSDVVAETIARGTPGFSGADLMNLVNEAALIAARSNKRVVTMHDFEEAKDKVMMGTERRSLVMKDDEKKLTAYHEAGHALVSLHMEGSDPIHKATIIPRGRALGMVVRLPEGDRISLTRQKLRADLAVAMGGRVAEELIFGYDKVTTGASSDIQQATEMARNMVTRWGLSDNLGPILYGDSGQQEVFLGHSVTQSKNLSEATAQKVDAEVFRIVDEGYKMAQKLLKKHMKDLHLLAEALLEYETLTGDEIKDLLAGKKILRVVEAPQKGMSMMPKSSAKDSQKPTSSSKANPSNKKGAAQKSGTQQEKSAQAQEKENKSPKANKTPKERTTPGTSSKKTGAGRSKTLGTSKNENNEPK